MINCTKFNLNPSNSVCCHVFLLCDNATLRFDLRPWKSLSVFLSSWWSISPSCVILDLMVHSVFCLQRFLTMWQYDLNLWSWKTIGVFFWSCWSNVQSCKILELTVRPTRLGQTDVRRQRRAYNNRRKVEHFQHL